MKRIIRLVIYLTLIASISYISIIHNLIAETAKNAPPRHADYLVILGAKINGKEMSLALYNRVKVALRYLKENPQTIVIVSGGQGPGEDITEAEAMSTYLIKEGISVDRIILEDQSTTTYENLSYSMKLLNPNKQMIIVSNDFHLFRSKMIAERLGYKEVYTLPAETPWIVKPKLWIREYAAVCKTWLFDR
ncbi:YdcF family protein [Bacillus pinisoli]|uniref:YdcF family protein n=1 Tax=Bacillus pinisoli TaxID=2901866 RepID=UPI001FF4E6B7|nr:YdcF family protein [Bacillus pinisoli]